MNQSVLDDLIAVRTAPSHRQDPAMVLLVRRLARVVAVPSLVAMLSGLFITLIGNPISHPSAAIETLPGPSSVSFYNLAQPEAILTGLGAMSLGLLMLAGIPAATILFMLIRYLRARRWLEAVIAMGVLVVLTLSATVGH